MKQLSPLLRVVVTLGLLGALLAAVGPGEILSRLRVLDPLWLAVAVAVSVVQVGVSAWRWRYTASRLGLELPLGHAVREYYLASFLNQVLPGGVLGDVTRAWRNAGGGGIPSVVLERASGQVVVLGAAVAAVAVLPLELPAEPAAWAAGLAGVGLAAVAAGGVASPIELGPASSLHRLPGVRRVAAAWRRVRRDVVRGLLHPRVLPVQLATSLLVVGSYVAVYVAAALAVGAGTPLPLLALLVPPVLVAMLIPVSFAGWGVREGAAAVLWTAVGRPASEGVAVSVAYGLLVLLTSLPGAWILLRSSGPGRRERRTPARRDGRAGEAPRPGTPRPGG